jgi:hypothetical protein
MIVVIATVQVDQRSGRKERIVSHGVNIEMLAQVTLPPIPLEQIGAVWNDGLLECVIG